MKAALISHPFFTYFKEKSAPFLTENRKIIIQFIFTAFFIGIGIWFIKHEGSELIEVKKTLRDADAKWVLAGVGITCMYIALQSLMYVASFATVRTTLSFGDAIILFLKRNLISVFLPAGGISSLAFFTKSIQKKGIKETQIYFASSIYGFVGILSVLAVAFPAFLLALSKGETAASEWYALEAVVLLSIVLWLLYYSFRKKNSIYHRFIKSIPKAAIVLEELQNNTIDKRKLLLTFFYSVLIEIAGIAHLYIAMIALHFEPSLFAAVMGYIVAVIFLIVSPFLRGLGAIEISMSYILIRFGFGNIDAIALTFLFRFLEFWLPLLGGIFAFLIKINKLLMRIIPALLLFTLGIVNIISVLTPAIHERLTRLQSFLPVTAIHASNDLVLVTGLFLFVTAAFMLKGLRTAWWFALVLSTLSVIGNLTKAIDFEEASIAFVVILILIATRKEYYIRNNRRLRTIGLQTALLSGMAVVAYGSIGFYFLDRKHFSIDFSVIESIRYTLQTYFLIDSANLVPQDPFAKNFLSSIKISGFLATAFLIYTLIRPYVFTNTASESEIKLANSLLKLYGNSGMDYFKTYADKLFFFSKNKNAFIAYRISGNFGVVLGNPVAADAAEMKNCIQDFDRYCYESGLKSIYYRVPEENLSLYTGLGKKSLFLGQEGIISLDQFTLEGPARKSLRNGLNKIGEKGLKTVIYTAPIPENILQKLKTVSEEWLITTGRKEIIFSQGMFIAKELAQQTLITVEDSEDRILAFLNIIPDYTPGEGTYDLIRKTKDAPNGIMDFILVALFQHFKSAGKTAVNLGFAPLSGIVDPDTFQQKSMKFAYERIKSFSHYRGLRDYKEKFSPEWHNQYLLYSNDYDLLQVPAILSHVIKP